jgi:hypothetical protein
MNQRLELDNCSPMIVSAESSLCLGGLFWHELLDCLSLGESAGTQLLFDVTYLRSTSNRTKSTTPSQGETFVAIIYELTLKVLARRITIHVTLCIAIDELNAFDAVDILAFPFFWKDRVCIILTLGVVVGVDLSCYSTSSEDGDC